MSFLCELNGGYQLGCSLVGGVEKVWIGEWASITSIEQDTCGIITGITSASPLECYSFEQDVEHAGLTQTGQFSTENGTVFYESTLSIKLIGLDCNVRNRMVELGRSKLFAVILSNAGDYYFLGVENAGRTSAAEASVGTLLGDMNGLSLSVLWKSANGAYLMAPSVLGTDITIL